jgi:hypothetical protein
MSQRTSTNSQVTVLTYKHIAYSPAPYRLIATTMITVANGRITAVSFY